jgi:hypothetical protein
MNEKGKINILRRRIAGPPPGKAFAVRMTVDEFLAGLNVQRDGGTVTLYVDPALSKEITGPGNGPLRLTLIVEYPERPGAPHPSPTQAESRPKPSDTPSGESCAKPMATAAPKPKMEDPW